MSRPFSSQDLSTHAAFVRAVAGGLAQDEDRADDLVQDTFLVGLERGPRDPERVRGWLRTVCRNVFFERLRSDERRLVREREVSRREDLPSTLDEVEHRAVARSLREALLALDDADHELLCQRYFDELPPREIAARRSVPVGAVKRRLERARERLRQRLRGEGRLASLVGVAAKAPAAPGSIGMGGMIVLKKSLLVVVSLLVLAGLAFLGVELLGERGVTELATTDAPVESSEPRRRPADVAAAVGEAELSTSGPDATPVVPAAAVDRDRDLFGRVVDQAGLPVVGALVEAISWPWRRVSILRSGGWDESVVSASTRSSVDGTFVLRLSRGDAVDLRVSAEGYAPRELEQRLAGERVDVVLATAGVLQVVVTDESGRPVADAEVMFRRQDVSRPDGGAYDERRARTGVEGRVRFTDLAPGDGRVSVTAAGYVDGIGMPVVVAHGAPVTHEVVLTKGATLTGLVVDAESGAPIAGARVSASFLLRDAVRTDGEGRFSLPGCRERGRREVHCVADGYGRAARSAGDASHVEIRLERGDAVVGVLVGDDGAPLADARVSAVGAATLSDLSVGSDAISGASDASGRFSLRPVRRDMAHTLVVQAHGHGRWLLDFGPSAGGTGLVDLGEIRVPAARRLEGRILDERGEPAEGVTVTVTGSNEDRGARYRFPESESREYDYGSVESRRCDDLGRFRFPELAPGRYRVTASRLGRPSLSESVLIGAADVLDLELVFAAAPPFVVRLRDEAGAAVSDLRVTLLVEGATRFLNQTTDDGGTVTFEGVAIGKRVELCPVVRDGRFVQPEALELVHGADTGVVEIELRSASVLRGIVREAGGSGIGGLLVGVVVGDRTIARVATDATGAFKVAVSGGLVVDLVVDASALFASRSRSSRRYEGRLDGVLPPRDDLVLIVRPVAGSRTLTVLVRDPAGNPVPGTTVWGAAAGLDVRAETDADGRALLTDLPATEISVATLSGADSAFVGSARLAVLPAGQTVVVTLRVGVWITGIVVDRDGQPVPGARIEALTAEYDGRAGHTGVDGRFALQVAAGQRYTLTASSTDPVDDQFLQVSAVDVVGGEHRLELAPRR